VIVMVIALILPLLARRRPVPDTSRPAAPRKAA
jgi:hypothetical protein